MKRLNCILRERRGETLVEVMVSIVLFLMLMAVLSGAIDFASNAQRRAEDNRNALTAMQQALRQTPAIASTTETTYQFKAISADGTAISSTPLFDVAVVQKQTQPIGNADGQATFYFFGKGGGGS